MRDVLSSQIRCLDDVFEREMTMAVQILNRVPYVQIPRISTGVEDLDWIYGGEGKNWGLPAGKISLWKGPSGTGKSRSLITIATNMSSAGHRVLYFQNEVTLSDFRAWIGKKRLPLTLYGSEATSLDEQIEDILKVKATFVIVDSVNQINEFGNGHKSAINKIYNRYRAVTKKTGVHIAFICHLDKQNQIKGGSELKFLSDTVISLGFHFVDKVPLDGHFTVNIGDKHRYGRTGSDMTTLWKHTDDGAICLSNNRLSDKDWCDGHRLEVLKSVPYGHLPQQYHDPISGCDFYEPDKKFFKFFGKKVLASV